jgi:hypothetical protein
LEDSSIQWLKALALSGSQCLQPLNESMDIGKSLEGGGVKGTIGTNTSTVYVASTDSL